MTYCAGRMNLTNPEQTRYVLHTPTRVVDRITYHGGYLKIGGLPRTQDLMEAERFHQRANAEKYAQEVEAFNGAERAFWFVHRIDLAWRDIEE